MMAIRIQRDTDPALEHYRLVEQGGHPHPRVSFVAQLANPIAFACLNRATPLNTWLLFQQARRMTNEEVFGQALAGLGRTFLPGCSCRWGCQMWKMWFEQSTQLTQSFAFAQQLAPQGLLTMSIYGRPPI